VNNPSPTKRGLLIVISGPSGVGKDTVIKRLLELDPKLRKTVSYTTRSRRKGEVEGMDYLYVSRKDLESRILEGQTLEHAEYDGNLYATSAAQVDERLNDGYDTILKIDVQGAEQVRLQFPDALFIFIAPPSMDELYRRQIRRNTETFQDMTARRLIAQREMDYKSRYDYVVVNDDVERAAREILEIIRRARERQT
jgi:guanylate kinase